MPAAIPKLPNRSPAHARREMKTQLLESIATLRDRVAESRRAGRRVGLVPTMGALHAGYARLIEHARRGCEFVVVSIFVNPLQFDREADLNQYPRTLEANVDMCDACGVDVGRIADSLCGRHRPGHFRGVATVVMKLFQIVLPDRAYFGEKDAQQLAVIRHLVRDFNIPVSIEGIATVRDADGVALSSRNQRLDPEERVLARSLYRALCEAKLRISLGGRDAGRVKTAAGTQLPRDDRLRLEYLEIVDPDNIQPVERIEGPVLVAGALWVGSTRLIDNLLCNPPASPPRDPADMTK